MKIDFTQIFMNMECEPMKEGEKAITLKKVATGALLSAFDDERNLAGEEKVKRFNLAAKIQAGDTLDLKTEEIAEIKKLIGKAYTVIIVGQAWAMLEKE